MSATIISEAKRLHKLGFGIILLHPKSKRPKENKWTTGARQPWTEVESKISADDNIGVRLGEASKIGDNYLACIDVDIKDAAYKDIALARLKEITGLEDFPEVRSGSGNGSRHLYCLTNEPFKMITAGKEKDKWEICIYSSGRQMVISPSIHPSGTQYKWVKPVKSSEDFPILSSGYFQQFDIKATGVDKSGEKPAKSDRGDVTVSDFVVVDVDLKSKVLHDTIYKMITTGEGAEDRSAMLLPICSALFNAGFTKNEILNILTDEKYYIGKTGFDHAQTTNRTRAAQWVWKYTLKRVFDEGSAEHLFREPIKETRELTFDEQVEQEALLEETSWTDDLDMTDNGKYRATLKNILDILIHEVGDDFVRRDLFAYRDAYHKDTPWGGKAGAALIDDDNVLIKDWLSRNWGFEPSQYLISEALLKIALANAYDPVIDYLEALPAWDGESRLDTWLIKYFGVKPSKDEGHAEYYAQVFRKWIFGMVLRAYKPGAKFDWMPILEGKQGVGKSSFGRLLVGEKYFLDWLPDLADKDSSLALQGAWTVEMGELPQFRRSEVEVLKAFVTRKVDKFRPPHGRRNIESARRCVFFGTTNNATYLKDDSGNRRFKPLEVGALNFTQLEADRDQLFAEAKYLYDNGFETEKTYDLEDEAALYENKIHAQKMVLDEADLMLERLYEFKDKMDAQTDPKKKFDFSMFSMLSLFENSGEQVGGLTYSPPLAKWKMDARNVQFAGKALKKLGATKGHTKRGSMWFLTENE